MYLNLNGTSKTDFQLGLTGQILKSNTDLTVLDNTGLNKASLAAKDLKADDALYLTGDRILHRSDNAHLSLFLGLGSGQSITSGYGNYGFGTDTLASLTTGVYNIAIGYKTLYSVVDKGQNIGIGREALYNNISYDNIGIGVYALYTNSDAGAYRNIGIGVKALYSNATGYLNIALGYEAAYSCSSGNTNLAIGNFCLHGLISGRTNCAIGYYTARNLDGNYNIIIGSDTHDNTGTTGDYNILIGRQIARNVTGDNDYNIGMGFLTLVSLGGAHWNIAIGSYAANQLTTGRCNTYFGNYTGYNNLSGIFQTALGHQAGYYETGDYTLHIHSGAATSSPLIYGEFNNRILKTYGGVNINAGQMNYDTWISGDVDPYVIYVDASTDNVGIGTNTPSTKLDIASNEIRIEYPQTIVNSTDPGKIGTICWDKEYIYVCIDSDTWKRVQILTW